VRRALLAPILALVLACAPLGAAAAFDHSHAAWTALLKRHVVVSDGGHESRVRYGALARERAALHGYLEALSAVGQAEFDAWTQAQRAAFLINAYNAFTVELVLTRYPDLRSIRDLGSVPFGSPWKKRFFRLLGRETHLDAIEHEMLRSRGAYDEPRIHFAVNCASVGCPMLREEAYVADRLEAQLEDQTRRFLSDRARNRFDPVRGRLEVSRIFDWFAADWTSGYRGLGGRGPAIDSREQFFARYAALLTDAPEHRRLVAAGKAPLAFLEYDWALNDAQRNESR
jgi:hypothetical protein